MGNSGHGTTNTYKGNPTALEATWGQIDGFLSQHPYKCHLEEVASVGEWLKICPQLDSRVEGAGLELAGSQLLPQRPHLLVDLLQGSEFRV